MGGLMTYQRMRLRNGLMQRKPDDDPDPYWRGGLPSGAPENNSTWTLVGDMNRMERDYLTTGDPDDGLAGRVADVTGVPADDVRKVLRYVFLEQP
jgi:hypothetical protein